MHRAFGINEASAPLTSGSLIGFIGMVGKTVIISISVGFSPAVLAGRENGPVPS